jgi:pimeloyl-ACP methyl ester carboxylesterase
MGIRRRLTRVSVPVVGAALVSLIPLGAQTAASTTQPEAVTSAPYRAPTVEWEPCAEGGFECATVPVPKDYRRPRGDTLDLAVTRLPAKDEANRIGSLFINYGGPGAGGVEVTQNIADVVFASFRDRFDIVSFDPRGTGASEGAIDCHANQETEGIYSQPYMTPQMDLEDYLQRVDKYVARCREHNAEILPYVSTANAARDMDLLRRVVGDKKLSYLGFSYGTYLGATYAAIFPDKVRALVLDGAVDPDQYANDPMGALFAQTAAFERGFGRLMQACAAHLDFCTFADGDDPWMAFDELVAAADRTPIPASGDRPVDGQDILQATVFDIYSKVAWTEIVTALNEAAAGDASLMRQITDAAYGRLEDGTFDPFNDRYFTISAVDAYGKYPRDVGVYENAGYTSWSSFDHFWFNTGYVELNWARLQVKPNDIYDGPFTYPGGRTPLLVIGTTYDPATPYRGAVRAVEQLGNARLLTMQGDGHTAYFGNSECIDDAVDSYLIGLTVPPQDTVCRQEVPFPLKEEETPSERRLAPATNRMPQQLHAAPFGSR